MSAIRVPLLCAFAGGCLSGAIVLGVWRADNAAAIPAQKQLARSNELLAAAIAASSAEQQRAILAEASRTPSKATQAEPDRGTDPPVEPSAAKDTQELASAAPTPAGSAVSDVLTDLEAAYRQRLVTAAPVEAPAAPEAPPAPAATAIAAAERAPEPAPPAPPVAPVVAVAPPPALVALAPAPIAPIAAPPDAPPAAAAPAYMAQNDLRPPDIHYGDVNQNTYITNVRQGDVYVVQQQLALMQYMQLLGASSAAGMAQPSHAHVGRGAAFRGVPQAAPQYKQFPSTLTNPDNPWGFNFAPPNLVH